MPTLPRVLLAVVGDAEASHGRLGVISEENGAMHGPRVMPGAQPLPAGGTERIRYLSCYKVNSFVTDKIFRLL